MFAMGLITPLAFGLAFAAIFVSAQQPIYGQCGGIGWTGGTTCASGSVCTYSNPYYSQCLPGSGGTTVATTVPPASTTVTSTTPSQTQNYNQPILWQDLADLEVIRVNDTFYYTASTMHYSPGAPILRSYDLVNWEYAGHAVPVLDWSSKYDLTTSRAYVKGIWASSIKYRKSNGLFYWIGCIEFSQSWIYTSPSASGPWTRHGPLSTCYYDAGLLIDNNDVMYVAYGNTNINVAQLSADGFSQVKTQQVFASPSAIGTIEGSRMYQINGKYYILVTQPTPGGEWVLQSTSGTPWGPYSYKQLVRNVGNPVPGGAGPHQGGIVDLADGRWYYIGFVDAYPGGRLPVMIPISWGSDGFPAAQFVNGQFGTSYPYPLTPHPLKSALGTFTFSSPLSPEWEWNHNPDTTKFSFPGNGVLKLSTATVTVDLYSARNSLTRRIVGPQSTATIVLDYSGMTNGDRAGLALLRDQSAWIGIKKDNGGARVVMINGIIMNTSDWSTNSTGGEAAAGGSIPATGKIWLRVAADIRPSSSSPQGLFSYSTDGNTFTRVGPAFVMNKDWQFFMGYRFAVFNYGTSALGGSVNVNSFTISQ